LQNSPLESSCVVVALIENYSTSKLLKVSPEKSLIVSCDTVVANARCVPPALASTNFILPRQCIYVFYTILTSNTNSFSERHLHTSPSNGCGPGSSVSIVTGYGLDGPEIESRWGARFATPVQTGPGSHPASCTMGTGSFPGGKSGRGVTLTPHPLLGPLVMKE